MPTIFRHTSRELFLTIHVDDILLIGSADDIQWYDKTFKQIFTMKNSEMCSVASGGEINYLKKRITCMVSSPSQAPGILLQPNKAYIPKLVQMFKLDGKKSKSLPHHADLSVYHADSVSEIDWLKGEEVTLFRSGLGIALYLAQDRPDIQHTVRVLSSFMGSPTKKALVWLKHLCLYLKNSEDYGLFYPESEAGTTLPDHWCFPHGLQNRQKRADYVVEVFSDSNWGGCTVTRKSTSSAVICVGGCVVHSHSRGQTSVALSSCEAELLASRSALSEGLQLTQILKFLLDDKQEKSTKIVETVVYTDSSSSRALMMRKGQGRLKHLSIRHLWMQGLVKLGMVEIIKIDTKNNPADLNTKALSVQRRKFLMSLMNMWCDGDEISFTVQVPGHDELAGVVARVILALSSLPTTKGMSTEVVEQKESYFIDPWWIKFASMAATFCLSVFALVWMNPGRIGDSGSPQPEEEVAAGEERIEDTIPIPPCSDDQRITYLTQVAEMFYVTITGQHDEFEVRRRFRGGEISTEAVHETLFQLQLLTRALMDGYYQVAAEMMELSRIDDVTEHQVLSAIRRLKDTYVGIVRSPFNEIGHWLYTKHEEYLRSVGRNLTVIEEILGVESREPDAEPHLDIDQDDLDEDGMLIVEGAEDRLRRYRATPMEECSDPELWMELNHWGETDSDDM